MILVTNDDGIESPGLTALAQALETIDDVCIVAPDRERSAIGMAITLYHPLRAKQVGDRSWAVDGTPVDCVDLAVSALLPEHPKLLVSGVNQGQNLGQDIHFSGTVAAAKKGTFLGIPSMAVSLISGQPYHYETATSVACRLAKLVLASGLTPGILLNINVPNCPLSMITGFEAGRQDLGTYSATAIKRIDRVGKPYYWIGGERAQVDAREDSDLNIVKRRCVSISPVQLDFTAHHEIEPLKRWLKDENLEEDIETDIELPKSDR
jgi:5'-nucleotidase